MRTGVWKASGMLLAAGLMLGSGACGSEDGPLAFGESCEPDGKRVCEEHLTCAERDGGGSACFHPVVLSGFVFDLETRAALQGAHVLALNEEATAVSDVAISAEDGTVSGCGAGAA